MTILLHGENVTASRNELTRLKELTKGEILVLEGKDIDKSDLTQALQTDALFDTGDRLVIVENFSANKKLLEDLPEIEKANLILWEGKKLTAGQISTLTKKFPGFREQEFKVDPIVFKFVESIFPANQKVMIPLWRKYSLSEEPEIAFTMIVRQFRLLMLAKEDSGGPDEFERLSPWQKGKLAEQAKEFETEELKERYAKLLQLDFQNKSGTLIFELATAIELFLLAI